MRVEAYLQSVMRAEVSSRVVGAMVIQGLKDLDPIAYIRYAIVYLGLDDLESVRSEIDKLLAEQQVTNRGTSEPVEASGEDVDPLPDEGFASAQAPAGALAQPGGLSGRSRRIRDTAQRIAIPKVTAS